MNLLKILSENLTTYRALIRLLPTMNPHVYQQFVSGIEWSSPRTSLPETGELVLSASGASEAVAIFVLVLVSVPLNPSPVAVRVRRGRFDVTSLDVTHQALLFGKGAATIYPSAMIRGRQVVVGRRTVCRNERVSSDVQDACKQCDVC